MASQVQLTNTFNEFRQAYNDAANDITTLQTSNTALYGSVFQGTTGIVSNTVQVTTLEATASRVVFTAVPDSGDGAVLDDDAGLIYHAGNTSLELEGNLDVGGSVTVTGNTEITGTTKSTGTFTLVDGPTFTIHSSNGTITSATGNVELNNTSSSVNAYHIHATLHVAAGGNVEDWSSGKGTDPVSHHIAAIGDQDEAVDMVVTNSSDGANAYAEFIAVNDTGTIENGWVSFGINSSNYGEGEYAVTKADDAYVLYQPPTGTLNSGDLVIGTGSNGTGNKILFSANGFDDPANNTQMIIHPGNKVEIAIDTESSNTSTGALVVRGGMGLTGNLNVGGNTTITGSITLLGSGNTVTTDSLAVENPIIFVGQNNAADTFDLGFVGIYNDGVEKYAGFVRDASESGMFKLFANTVTLPANTVDFTDAGLQYGAVMVGEVQIVDTTASTSNTTGALIVSGGVGISGSTYTSGIVRVTNTTTSTGTGTGAVVISGGVGISGNTNIGGILSVDDDIIANASSDERLKENVLKIDSSLDKIDQIGGYTFDWNETAQQMYPGRNIHDVGVLAQEIQKVLPEAVVERENGYLAVNYDKIIPLLIESIKELKTEISNLKKLGE